jgi:hypothetical protein
VEVEFVWETASKASGGRSPPNERSVCGAEQRAVCKGE